MRVRSGRWLDRSPARRPARAARRRSKSSRRRGRRQVAAERHLEREGPVVVGRVVHEVEEQLLARFGETVRLPRPPAARRYPARSARRRDRARKAAASPASEPVRGSAGSSASGAARPCRPPGPRRRPRGGPARGRARRRTRRPQPGQLGGALAQLVAVEVLLPEEPEDGEVDHGRCGWDYIVRSRCIGSIHLPDEWQRPATRGGRTGARHDGVPGEATSDPDAPPGTARYPLADGVRAELAAGGGSRCRRPPSGPPRPHQRVPQGPAGPAPGLRRAPGADPRRPLDRPADADGLPDLRGAQAGARDLCVRSPAPRARALHHRHPPSCASSTGARSRTRRTSSRCAPAVRGTTCCASCRSAAAPPAARSGTG